MLGQLTEILDGPAFSGSTSPSVGTAVETWVSAPIFEEQ